MSVQTHPIQKQILSLAVFALVAVVGCGGNPKQENAPTQPQTNDRQPAEKKSQLLAVPENAPVIALTADEFYQTAKKDPKAAYKKFKGSFIEVTGKVGHISTSEVLGKPAGLLFLKGVDVWCYTKETRPWTKVNKGQTVKVKGVCNQMDADLQPYLYNCVFVDLKPNPVPSLSAEQLAKEFATDKNAALKKYEEKYLVIRGEVVSNQKADYGSTDLYLKGQDTIRVWAVGFNIDQERTAATVKVGQKITILGEIYRFDEKEKAVVTNPSSLID